MATSTQARDISVSQNQNPVWVNDAGQNLYAGAVDLVNGDNGAGTYTAPRIADWTEDQTAAFDQVRNRQGATAPLFEQSHSMFTDAGEGYGAVPKSDRLAVGDMAVGDMTGPAALEYNDIGPIANVSAQQIGGIKDVTAERVGTGKWDSAAATEYMNPYIQTALDPATKEIDRQAAISARGLGSKAATVGALGSKRHGVALAENTRDAMDLKNRTVADMYLTGYDKAGSMFTSDQGRKLTADTSNQSTSLEAGQGNQRTELERQKANQDADLRGQLANQSTALSTATSNQSNRFNVGQQNQDTMFNVGKTNLTKNVDVGKYNMDKNVDVGKTNVSSSQFDIDGGRDQFNKDQDRKIDAGEAINKGTKDAYDISRTDSQDLFNVGTADQEMDQRGLDLAYGDYLDQRSRPYEDINFLSGVLNNTPYDRKTVTDQNSAPVQKGPSTLSTVLGAATSIGSMFI